MCDKKTHTFCSEFYTVEKSIEVVVTIQGQGTRIRIDSLRDGETGNYSTRAYIAMHLTLQPTYPQTSGSFDSNPRDFRIWVDYDLPWTHRDSADAALGQALGFLGERCSNM